MVARYEICLLEKGEHFFGEWEKRVLEQHTFTPKIGMNVLIDGKHYHVNAISESKKLVGVRDVEFNEEPEEEEGDEMVCPFCSYEQTDVFEYRDDEDTVDCQNCGSEITYVREYTVTFTVTPEKKKESVVLR